MPNSEGSNRQRIKLDQGYKPLLRGSRDTLFEMFEQSSLARGIYHWSDKRLFEQVKLFMQSELEGFANPTNYEVWACALLIYPTKGINNACKELCDTLGNDGIRVFRTIFVNNNSTLIREFFEHPFMQKLWPQIVSRQSMEYYCFKGKQPNENIRETYCKITGILKRTFNL